MGALNFLDTDWKANGTNKGKVQKFLDETANRFLYQMLAEQARIDTILDIV